MGARSNLEGKRFSRLLVLHSIESKPRRKWMCVCDCGNNHIVESWLLNAGLVRSCGCLQKESASNNGKATATHNMSNKKEYVTHYREWTRLKTICRKHNVAIGKSISDSFTHYLRLIGGHDSPMRIWVSDELLPLDESNYVLFSPKERARVLRRHIAAGTSIKNGRIEITVGENKFRKLHSVLAERHILGRRLLKNEVVHHIDGNPMNNDVSNLQVMMRSEHAAHHAKQFLDKRERNNHGQFV